ncbi:MAG: HD domain-containing protein [Elusimicrobiota bacterium]
MSVGTVSVESVKSHPLVKALITAANQYLGEIGYTEHGFRHCTSVSTTARDILIKLGYKPPYPELAAIAGYLHDIGNVVNRIDHGQSSAVMALEILESMKLPTEYIADIISAIGNHEEDTGVAVNAVCAALIIGDKTDVHRKRVRKLHDLKGDIHDRVNYAVVESGIKVDKRKKNIVLHLNIDTKISQVMEYFEIFLSRMLMCQKAAEYLGYRFSLVINKTKLL